MFLITHPLYPHFSELSHVRSCRIDEVIPLQNEEKIKDNGVFPALIFHDIDLTSQCHYLEGINHDI